MTLNVFNDLEFESVVREFDTPDVEGWEFFTESHGVKIYRLYNEVLIRYWISVFIK